jgi:predicted methyltransferase
MTFSARSRLVALGAAILATVGGAYVGVTRASGQAAMPDYAALVAAPDRSDADRQVDKRRDPVPLLNFVGLQPGMKVLDMGAGAGYSTELDARSGRPAPSMVRMPQILASAEKQFLWRGLRRQQ